MIKKRHISVLALAFCLTASFIVASVGYDPWVDLDDDGYIGPDDFGIFAGKYGTSGTPINKTELLLELEARINALNASMIDLESRVTMTEDDITTMMDTIETMQENIADSLSTIYSDVADLQSDVYSLNQSLEARIPKKGLISVPASAFVPMYSDKATAIAMFLVNREPTSQFFFGSIQLPNGTTVTKMTVYFYDSGAESIECGLYRYYQSDWETMGYAWSKIDTGYGTDTDFSIQHATVDNGKYAYYMRVEIPPSAGSPYTDYYFQYATIEYEYQA